MSYIDWQLNVDLITKLNSSNTHKRKNRHMKKLNLITLREYKTPMSFVNLFCLTVNTENRLLNLREPENLKLANETLRLADGEEADLFNDDEDFYLVNLDVYNIPKTMNEAKQRICSDKI